MMKYLDKNYVVNPHVVNTIGVDFRVCLSVSHLNHKNNLMDNN
jgi:hypothetical protein